MRRIGVLNSLSANDEVERERVGAFLEALAEAGWVVGRNVQVDLRWGEGDVATMRSLAADLVALSPDVILATGSVTLRELLRATATLPIVFTNVRDPVGAGFIDSLSRPGGNATGFAQVEFGLAGKWLELLKQVVPGMTRAAVLRDPGTPNGVSQFAAIQSVAPGLGIALTPVDMRDPAEIERAAAALSSAPRGGWIVTGSPSLGLYRKLILDLAARHGLPACYPFRYMATGGGLLSYGADPIDLHRHAAGYVDRILRGDTPGGLPVQQPSRFELVINLRTAKALGVTIPPALLALADEVIE